MKVFKMALNFIILIFFCVLLCLCYFSNINKLTFAIFAFIGGVLTFYVSFLIYKQHF